jgi:hypothetical protein
MPHAVIHDISSLFQLVTLKNTKHPARRPQRFIGQITQPDIGQMTNIRYSVEMLSH